MDYKKKYLKYKEKYLNYRTKYSSPPLLDNSDSFLLNKLEPNIIRFDNNKSLKDKSLDIINDLKDIKVNINELPKIDINELSKIDINELSKIKIKTKTKANIDIETKAKINEDDLEDGEFTDINKVDLEDDKYVIPIQKQKQIDILGKTIQKIDIKSITTTEPVINYNFAESIINDNTLINIENGNIVFNIYTHPNYRISVYNNTISFAGLSIILNDNMDTNDNIKIDDIDNKTFECKHIINIPNSNLVNGVTITQLLKIINMEKPIKTDKFFIKIIKIHDKLFEELLIKYNKEIDIDIDSYNKNQYISYEKNNYNNEYNINNMYDFL